MTDTVNVLPHLQELKDAWRKQDFVFTKQQQEEYDLLLNARRERVKYFYANDMVCKVSKSAQDKLKEDN
jgi:proteasome lid subunit RPN8/RPN11